MVNVFSWYKTGKEISWYGKKQLSTFIKINWTKNHFYNLTALAYSYNQSHLPADKCMDQVIFDYTKNVKLWLTVHHEIIVKCKRRLGLLSFCMFPAWVKHQIVNISI